MKSHPYLTHEEYTRVVAYFKTLTAFLKENALRTGHWEDFVRMCGPDLRRHPWQEQLYDRTTLRKIDQAMRGKEEFYSDTHDLLSLLQLQFDPITSDQRREVSRSIASQTGLFIPDKSIVQMTDREVDAAMMRLAAASVSSAPDLQPPEVMKFFQWNVPHVLHTAVMMHTLPGRNGRKVRVQPMQLPLPIFRLWFQERLLRTVVTRSQHAPENPVWFSPGGTPQSTRRFADPTEELRAYNQVLELTRRVCEPAPRGRPKGSGTFETREEFLAALRLVIRHVRQHNPPVTQSKVATYFHRVAGLVCGSDRQLRDWLEAFGLVWDEVRSSI